MQSSQASKQGGSGGADQQHSGAGIAEGNNQGHKKNQKGPFSGKQSAGQKYNNNGSPGANLDRHSSLINSSYDNYDGGAKSTSNYGNKNQQSQSSNNGSKAQY